MPWCMRSSKAPRIGWIQTVLDVGCAPVRLAQIINPPMMDLTLFRRHHTLLATATICTVFFRHPVDVTTQFLQNAAIPSSVTA